MGRRRHMTDEAKTIAIRKCEKGYSVKEIMKVLQRSEIAVRKAIETVPVVKKRQTSGRTPKWTKRMKQRIIRKGLKGDKFTSDIRAEIVTPITDRRVQQIRHDFKLLIF